MGTLDIVVFFAFILSVIGVGMWKSKGEDTEGKDGAAEYFLAGRGLKWWLIGFSLIAANISAEQFVGMSGAAAGYMGLAISSYEWMAAITLVVVAFIFLPYFLRAGIFTIPEFLECRYNHWTRLMMTFFMMLILVGVSLTGVIYAGALTMKNLLNAYDMNINLAACCWIMGVMAAAYVAFGGLKACAWADLLQGSALIIGGGIIAYFAFSYFDSQPAAQIVDAAGNTPVFKPGAGVVDKFYTCNADKMHMVLPLTDKNIPWSALLIGLWIPNFYYWGLNQYITQRILGSASLAEGQKGLVFAGALKLVVPFVIVIPGILAFNLFSGQMAEKASKDDKIVLANNKVVKHFEEVKMSPATSKVVFEYDKGWAQYHSELVPEIAKYNTVVLARAKASGKESELKKETLLGYKYDSALSLLIGNLLPRGSGVFGFVLAALLGAIISSLAAILNASSTIFTMDVYSRYINKEATQGQLVRMGRILVCVFVVIGCALSPYLDDPRFGGIFKFIQEAQGFVTPGILAVFVFGIINRSAAGVTGVIGMVLNPLLYGLLLMTTELAFLDRMAVCFGAVLLVMTIIGLLVRLDKPVEFHSETEMDLTSSKPAMAWGVVVVIATLALYAVFF
jgi:SSS family solute:Na+ symporter